jgi:hypothetical protein
MHKEPSVAVKLKIVVLRFAAFAFDWQFWCEHSKSPRNINPARFGKADAVIEKFKSALITGTSQWFLLKLSIW